MSNGNGNGNGKPTKCPICREKLSSGKALGGHMSRHRDTRQRLAGWASGKAPQAKTQKCKICGVLMGSGRAIGGHMSKHSRGERPETAMASRVTYSNSSKSSKAQARAQANPSPDHRVAYAAATRKNTDVTVNFGPAMNQSIKLVDSLHAAAKTKRDEAAKLEASSMALVKTKRDEANELDRLAERVGHIL